MRCASLANPRRASGGCGVELAAELHRLVAEAVIGGRSPGRRSGGAPGVQVGIWGQTFYRWKKDYGGMLPSEARELEQLRDVSAKLKAVVVECLSAALGVEPAANSLRDP